MCRIIIPGRINRNRRGRGFVVFGQFVNFLWFLFGGNEIFCIFAIGRGRCHYLSQTNGC